MTIASKANEVLSQIDISKKFLLNTDVPIKGIVRQNIEEIADNATKRIKEALNKANKKKPMNGELLNIDLDQPDAVIEEERKRINDAVKSAFGDYGNYVVDVVHEVNPIDPELEKKNLELNTEVSGLKGKVTGLEGQKTLLNNQIAVLNAQITALTAQVTALTNDLAALTNDLAALTTERDQAKAEKEKAEKELLTVRNELAAKDAELTIVKTELATTKNELTAAKNDLAAAVAKAAADLKDRDIEIAKLNNDINDLTTKHNGQMATLSKEKGVVESQARLLQDKLKDITLEKDNLARKINDAEKKIKDLIAQMATITTTVGADAVLQQTVLDTRAELITLQQAKDQVDQQLITLQQAKDDADKKILALEAAKIQILTDYNAEKTKITEAYDAKINELEKKAQDSDSEKIAAELKATNIEKSFNALDTKQKKLQTLSTDLLSKLTNMQNVIDGKEKTIVEQTKKIDEREAEINRNKLEKAGLEKTITELTEKNSKLTETNDGLREQIKKMQIILKDIPDKIAKQLSINTNGISMAFSSAEGLLKVIEKLIAAYETKNTDKYDSSKEEEVKKEISKIVENMNKDLLAPINSSDSQTIDNMIKMLDDIKVVNWKSFKNSTPQQELRKIIKNIKDPRFAVDFTTILWNINVDIAEYLKHTVDSNRASSPISPRSTTINTDDKVIKALRSQVTAYSTIITLLIALANNMDTTNKQSAIKILDSLSKATTGLQKSSAIVIPVEKKKDGEEDEKNTPEKIMSILSSVSNQLDEDLLKNPDAMQKLINQLNQTTKNPKLGGYTDHTLDYTESYSGGDDLQYAYDQTFTPVVAGVASFAWFGLMGLFVFIILVVIIYLLYKLVKVLRCRHRVVD